MTLIFLDMDGVLTDFDGALCTRLGVPSPMVGDGPRPWNYWPLLGVTAEEFWRPTEDEQFWATLPWMADGRAILAAVFQRVPQERVTLLTSPATAPASAAGKMRWVQRELPAFARRILIGMPKEVCAGPNKILIDDYDVNIDAWECAGGIGILVPRPWNRRWQERRPAPEVVAEELETALAVARSQVTGAAT